MAPTSPRVLIIDDDPSHLEIYGMIVKKAGFESTPVLVRFSGADPIPDSRVDLVLLDYRLNSVTTAPEIASQIRSKFPQAPIILLSDLWSAPADVAPFVNQLVRKGEPAKLVEVIHSHLSSEPATGLTTRDE
jgi:DNA-binding response OmpR family regulator